METDSHVKLRFFNPILNKADSITISKFELDEVRNDEDGPIISIISFLHEFNDSNHVISLYVDNEYMVRSVLVSNYFLRESDKLFR